MAKMSQCGKRFPLWGMSQNSILSRGKGPVVTRLPLDLESQGEKQPEMMREKDALIYPAILRIPP